MKTKIKGLLQVSLFLLAALCLIIVIQGSNLLVPKTTSALSIGDSFMSNDNTLEFTVTSSNEVSVRSGEIYDFFELKIPDSVTDPNGNTYSVTSIEDYGFESFNHKSSYVSGNLIIPDSVTSIGEYAFSGNYGFDGILLLPESIKTIGYAAFENCYNFTEIYSYITDLSGISGEAFSSVLGIPINCLDGQLYRNYGFFDVVTISNNDLSVTPASWNPTNAEQTKEFTVITGQSTFWTAIKENFMARWLTVSISGTGSGILSITVTENQSDTERTANVIVSAGGKTLIVKVRQERGLSVSQTEWGVLWTGEKKEFKISASSDESWIIRKNNSNDSWITILNSSGRGNGTFEISVNENKSTAAERSATITVYYGAGQTRSIFIEQGMAPEIKDITALEDALRKFEQSKWNVYTDSEKRQQIGMFMEVLTYELGLRDVPDYGFFDESYIYYEYSAAYHERRFLSQDDYIDYIGISANLLDDDNAGYLVYAITHEMRHAWQYMRADNPQTAQDYIFKENQDNYKHPSAFPIEEYLAQPMEVDARFYGNKVRGLFTSLEKVQTYTVTYNANGGSGAPNPITLNGGSPFYVSATKPVRAGYDFIGWSEDKYATFASYFLGEETGALNKDTTLYAVWKAQTYKVSYNANGGINAPSSMTINMGSPLYVPVAEPVRTGYTFLGWSENANAAYASYFPGDRTGALDKDTILYAVWQIQTYTVTYNANGGSGAPDPITLNGGSPLYVSTIKPVRANYDFLGWSEDRYATSASYFSGETTGALDKNTILYAVWRVQTYTVTYDANGGSGAPDPITLNRGSSFNVSVTKPTRAGYDFLGWSEDRYATSASYFSGETTGALNKNTTLYAVWRSQTYTVTYDANGGSGAPNPITLNRGSSFNVSVTKPTRAGYDFLGWSEDRYATYASYFSGETTGALNKNTTLYAVWRPQTYTVTYDAKGGSGAPDPMTINMGSPLYVPTIKPVRDGYDFLGWSEDRFATTASYFPGDRTGALDKDTTLYAVWATQTYIVRYSANGGSGEPNPMTINKGAPLYVPLAEPVRDGYDFLGWSEDRYATEASFFPGDTTWAFNTNTYLFAVWKVRTYIVVSYNANGGSNAPDSMTINMGSPLYVPTIKPIRDGYDFLGWSENRNAVYASYFPGDTTWGLDKDTILYAVWLSQTYKVTYNANGGINAPSSMTINMGSPLYVPVAEPVRVGYDFLGWSENANATTASYFAGETTGALNKDTILYAVWRVQAPQTYKVTYNANGGINAPSPMTINMGSPLYVPFAEPVRVGYDFLGWSENANATTASYFAGETTGALNKDTILYAVWRVCSHAWSSWSTSGINHVRTCSICGEIQSHAIIWSSYSYTSSSGHYRECLVCGTRSATQPHNLRVNSTNSGHYQVCSDCGYQTTPVSHTYEPWRDYTSTSHMRKCTFCGHEQTEAHRFGSWTNSSSIYHSRTCSVCNRTEYAGHSWGPYGYSGSGGHYRECSVCRTRLATEPHLLVTYYNESGHYQRCSICGYQTTLAQHTYGPWSDYLGISHKRRCTVCSHEQSGNHSWGPYGYSGSSGHYRECSVCKARSATQPHTLTTHSNGTTHYQSCSTCGYQTTPVSHTYGPWRDYTSTSHMRKCTFCGHEQTGAHSFGSWTNSSSIYHSRTCSVCNRTESAGHSWGPYGYSGSSGHYRECSVCRARSATQSHTLQTNQTSTGHYQRCSTCGYQTTPVSHTYGPWSNYLGLYHRRTCTVCKHEQMAAHSFGKWTSSSSMQHRRTCSTCGHAETGSHSWRYVGSQKQCTVCGYWG